MAMLDGSHRCHSAEILRDEDAAEWAAKSLRMPYAFRVDCKPISLAQAIELIKMENISTAIV